MAVEAVSVAPVPLIEADLNAKLFQNRGHCAHVLPLCHVLIEADLCKVENII